MYIKKQIYNKDCLQVAKEQRKYFNKIIKKSIELDKSYNDDCIPCIQDKINASIKPNFPNYNLSANIIKQTILESYDDETKALYDVLNKLKESECEDKFTRNLIPIPNDLKNNECSEWIGNEINIYKKGELQEERVEQLISIYPATFKKEYCLFNTVFNNYLGDNNNTRETDGILITDIGIFVLEIKSYENAIISDDNKIIKNKYTNDLNSTPKFNNKANEQVTRNVENIKTILIKNDIDINIIPLTVVSGYTFQNTQKGFMATPEEIYDRYIEKRNLTQKSDLYSDEELKRILSILKDEEIKKNLPIEYKKDETNGYYYISNRGKYPAFYKILFDNELDDILNLFEHKYAELKNNEELIEKIKNIAIEEAEQQQREEEEKQRIEEEKKKQAEIRAEQKKQAEEEKQRKEAEKKRLAEIRAEKLKQEKLQEEETKKKEYKKYMRKRILGIAMFAVISASIIVFGCLVGCPACWSGKSIPDTLKVYGCDIP